MQFESLSVDFDPRRLTKEHPFVPEGYLDDYYPLLEPAALHYHDFLEIGYCVQGSGLFYVDGEVVSFNGPCCTIIYGGQIHIAQAVDKASSLWHFCYINLQKLFTDTDLIAVGDLKAMFSHQYQFPALIPRQEDPILYELVSACVLEAAELREGYLTAMRGMLTAILARHSRYMSPAKRFRENQEYILNRLGETLIFINAHYMEDLSIEQLLRVAGVSKSTLQRDMIAFTGMAPMQYIHHMRIKHATLLLAGDSPIADIAFEVGYNSLSSFNRHFLRELGVSPKEWRRGHRP